MTQKPSERMFANALIPLAVQDAIEAIARQLAYNCSPFKGHEAALKYASTSYKQAYFLEKALKQYLDEEVEKKGNEHEIQTF